MKINQNEGFRSEKEKEDERDRYGFFWWWNNFARTVGSVIFLSAVAAGVTLMLSPGYFDPWLIEPKPIVETAAPAPEPAPPTVVEPVVEKVAVVTERKGDTVVFPIQGVDAQGRKAAFDVLILTKDYNWVKGSTTEVVKGQQTLAEAELLAAIFLPEVRDVLTKASDVIAVGAASSEGQSEAEIARADARSKVSAGWLATVVAPETPIWTLNLGQYQTCSTVVEAGDTSFQRPLILVGVNSKDADANLSEALANAIGGKSNLPSRDCYSRFDFNRNR